MQLAFSPLDGLAVAAGKACWVEFLLTSAGGDSKCFQLAAWDTPIEVINWDLLKDFSRGLEGNDFYFVVEAELVSKGVSFLWYLGGGAVVVGSAAAYLLSRSSKSEPVPTGGFPLPVGRPSGN